MVWVQFLAAALIIVLAGARLARYGDILGEKSGLGRSWIGVVLLAATTDLPEALHRIRCDSARTTGGHRRGRRIRQLHVQSADLVDDGFPPA